MKPTQIFTVAVFLIATTIPASATFPGKNGRIAFVQGPDIYTMNPDGSDIRQLTAFTDDTPAFGENWSADGKQLAFSRRTTPDFNGQLWLMNADGSNQHLLLNDPAFDDRAPSFSPDGGHVIFARCGPVDGELPCAIYRVDLNGSGLTQITPVRIELLDQRPVYSADGSTIAFESYFRDGVIAAIYLMNSDGTGIREVTEAELEGIAPDWSPDGRQLSFTSKCCNPELGQVVVIKRDGERVRQLTDDQSTIVAGLSSWSPQGDAIVFAGFDLVTGENGIYIINADSSGAKLVMKVRPATLLKHGPQMTPRSHFVKSKKGGTVTKIEDGGARPRWGSAQ